MMINLDPDTATQDGRVLKTVVRANNKNAGVYGVVVHTGRISVGDSVRLLSSGQE
jgi:MOSC domain-containing protein YiiM